MITVWPRMLDRKLQIPDHVLSQQVQEETVLLDLAQEQYFGLDAVGTRVWQCLAAGVEPADIVRYLAAEYDADEPRLRADLDALLNELIEAGLLATGR
jgi:hypothetical protein